MVPVFNDQSRHPLADNDYAARSRLSAFITVLAEAPDRGLTRGLRTADDFFDLEVAANYSLGRWLTDRLAARDEINYLLEIEKLTPALSSVSSTIADRALCLEVRLPTGPSPAYLAAYLLEVPLVSFDQEPWSNPILEAPLVTLEESGALAEDHECFVNISKTDHFDLHASWITERRVLAIESMRQLWDQRAALFPRLEFCPAVEAQLLAIGKNHDAFEPTLHHLFDMQAVTAARGGNFDPTAFKKKCSPSSQTTLDDFAQEYTFRRDGGQTVTCGWHFYLPAGWRIYFAVSGAMLIIGHVGSHLPTRLFPR